MAGGDQGDDTARHNHVTRGIKQRGQCPGCDAIHDWDPNGGRTLSVAAARPTAEEQLTELRGDIVDGVTRAVLREAVARWLLTFDNEHWDRADEEFRDFFRGQADGLLALPEMAALLDAARP